MNKIMLSAILIIVFCTTVLYSESSYARGHSGHSSTHFSSGSLFKTGGFKFKLKRGLYGI